MVFNVFIMVFIVFIVLINSVYAGKSWDIWRVIQSQGI